MRYRSNAVFTEQVGEKSHHHLAVLQHVAHAAGHTQVIFQHVVLTIALRIGCANNVNAADMRVNVAGYINPHHLGAELRVLENLLGRNNTGFQDVLAVVDVVNKAVECRDALHQAFFHDGPFVRRNDAGNQIKGNQAFGARAVFVFVTIDSKGDADPAKNHFSFSAACLHGLGALAGQPALVALVMRTHAVSA